MFWAPLCYASCFDPPTRGDAMFLTVQYFPYSLLWLDVVGHLNLADCRTLAQNVIE